MKKVKTFISIGAIYPTKMPPRKQRKNLSTAMSI
jgi:hypothetical protein